MDMGFPEPEDEYEAYAGGIPEEEQEPEIEAEHAEGAEAEEPLGEGQEDSEADSTLSSPFPTEYEEGGDHDRS